VGQGYPRDRHQAGVTPAWAAHPSGPRRSGRGTAAPID
jgi:hypothetical protein